MSLCIGAYKNNRVGQHGGLIKSGFIQNQVRVAVNFEGIISACAQKNKIVNDVFTLFSSYHADI